MAIPIPSSLFHSNHSQCSSSDQTPGNAQGKSTSSSEPSAPAHIPSVSHGGSAPASHPPTNQFQPTIAAPASTYRPCIDYPSYTPSVKPYKLSDMRSFQVPDSRKSQSQGESPTNKESSPKERTSVSSKRPAIPAAEEHKAKRAQYARSLRELSVLPIVPKQNIDRRFSFDTITHSKVPAVGNADIQEKLDKRAQVYDVLKSMGQSLKEFSNLGINDPMISQDRMRSSSCSPEIKTQSTFQSRAFMKPPSSQPQSQQKVHSLSMPTTSTHQDLQRIFDIPPQIQSSEQKNARAVNRTIPFGGVIGSAPDGRHQNSSAYASAFQGTTLFDNLRYNGIFSAGVPGCEEGELRSIPNVEGLFFEDATSEKPHRDLVTLKVINSLSGPRLIDILRFYKFDPMGFDPMLRNDDARLKFEMRKKLLYLLGVDVTGLEYSDARFKAY